MLIDDVALHTDFYQLTMAAAYHQHGLTAEASFSLFAHNLPATRGFMVAAGLEECLDILEGFRFGDRDIEYLRSLGRFSEDFLAMLADLRFTGEVWAMPEGTVCFGGEPLLEVTAPLIEAQLVETVLINVLNLHTTLASKAARCVLAAEGRSCVDFSLRRCQGLHAGLAAARSSALAGFTGTSNVEAAARYDLTPVGTMAHSFVEAFGDEAAAFEAFAETFGQASVFLVYTYDSESGLRRAIEVGQKLRDAGVKMLGVRLDSGDLAAQSKRARQMLDQAGLDEALVVVSGSLDEWRIRELVRGGAQVDVFGVGTRMGSSADAPYLDFAYKLVAYDGRPTLKLSAGKETWTERKQVRRQAEADGRINKDVLGLRHEDGPGRPLLERVMAGGRRTGARQGWQDAAGRYKAELAGLPEAALRLDDPEAPPVEVSQALKDLQARAREAALRGNHRP